jgi:hypothetical protein
MGPRTQPSVVKKIKEAIGKSYGLFIFFFPNNSERDCNQFEI